MEMSEPKPELTQRGFTIYSRFKDKYGGEQDDARVQESSIMGEPHCWIFSRTTEAQANAVHVDVENAKLIITGLKRFIAEAEGD